MKNAGIIPEEVELRKDIYTHYSSLSMHATMMIKRLEYLVKQLNAKQLRYTIPLEQKGIQVPDYETVKR